MLDMHKYCEYSGNQGMKKTCRGWLVMVSRWKEPEVSTLEIREEWWNACHASGTTYYP